MNDTTKRFPPEDRLGPLLNQHVKTILESGLLLDEDYEVLLSAANFKLYPHETRRLSLGIVFGGGVAVVGSLLLAFKIKRPSVIIPAAAANTFLFYLGRNARIKWERREEAVPVLVRSLLKLRRLNFTVLRYLAMRGEQSPVGFNESVNEFLQSFLKHQQEYFEELLRHLGALAEHTLELQEDFRALKDFDPKSLLNGEPTEETYQQLLSTVQDIYTILVSKYLNYLGLVWQEYLNHQHINVQEVLDNKIYAFKAKTDQHTMNLQQEFNNLRYSASKKLEISKSTSFSKNISGNLRKTLDATINRLSLILEQSRTVLSRIEEVEDNQDVKNLEIALKDLREQALSTYESLDVLCKLFGILSEANNQTVKAFNPKTSVDTTTKNAPTVNFDDATEALEENFELYIPEGAEEDLSDDAMNWDDQAGKYLSLMVKELKQSLKQHERFIAARNKRGVIQEEEPKEHKESAVPKFDLKVVNENVPHSSELLPPPPPPPLPPAEALDGSEGVCVSESKNSLLDSIRTLSGQLQREEEVFGSEGSSESSEC
ncbi:uncharacterized protein LOC126746053 isoform X2 [Anthonomus grandis grandis]|nr:uncharacterized protein LOC126746053 isoform X2 [Anthonomus grandis grandis]